MEANVKETRAEWPADGMASLIFPNGLRKIYGTLKDPKGQDAVMAWIGRYILTGEDRKGYKVPDYLKILLKDEVSRIFKRQRMNAEKGARGGRPQKADKKPTESQEKAERKPDESQTEASIKPNGSQKKADGKQREREREREIVGGKPPTTPDTHTSRVCAGARAGGDGEPAPADEPEAEAKRLGFGQYAPVAGELRELMGVVRAETMAATVFMAADGKGMSAEELLGWARHRQRQGWRTGQGGGVLITRANVASDIAIWAANQANFRRAGSADGARPTAAQQDGGAAEGKKPEKREWRFEKAEVDEDPYRYIWGLPDDALPQFAAWFCGESGNERAIGFYGRFAARNGHKALRVELDKFVGSVRSGEEPENRGAAFTAALKAAERSEP